MKFRIFVALLFLIYETFFYFVIGQTINNEIKSDCTKLYNFLNKDSKDYYRNCCNEYEVTCDVFGSITSLQLRL